MKGTNVDNTQIITHVSHCTGYGGIDLGLKRVLPSMRTIAYSEIEAFPLANLVSKIEDGYMDVAPIWTDIKTFPFRKFRGMVDIYSAGYPCQSFSVAGKQKGKDDPRHLWPWIRDGIEAMQPNAVFFENVEGHLKLGLREVLTDLLNLGYSLGEDEENPTWGLFSAKEVGAPHLRKRVFILAYRSSERLQRRIWNWTPGEEGSPNGHATECRYAWPARPGQDQYEWEPPRTVGNAKSQRCGEAGQGVRRSEERISGAGGELADSRCERPPQCCQQAAGAEQQGSDVGHSPMLNGKGQDDGHRKAAAGGTSSAWRNRKTQPPVGGDVDGFTCGVDYAELCTSTVNRNDELRLLGNGVLPAVAAEAFGTLYKRIGER